MITVLCALARTCTPSIDILIIHLMVFVHGSLTCDRIVDSTALETSWIVAVLSQKKSKNR